MFIIPRKVYLDHNATTPVAKPVIRTMTKTLKSVIGNASSLHTQGRVARGLIDQSRKTIADALAVRPDQIIFTSGGTESNNAIIKGLFLQKGKGHIITSRIEHDSILGACRQVELLGGSVTYLPAKRDGRISPEDILSAIQPDTILISIMHANNETGIIQPVDAIGRIANEKGIPFHTDAVQSFGKIDVNADAIGCEFMTITAHKINGPKGIGAMYWRGGADWSPLLTGGDQERGQRTGTESVHQIAGFASATDNILRRKEKEYTRLVELRRWFIQELGTIVPSCVVNEGPDQFQLPGTLSLTFPGKEGQRILAGLDCYEICVSIGSACTADRIEPSHVLLGMGIDRMTALSTIRLSMGSTTTKSEMKYTLRVLKYILSNDPPGLQYLDPQHLDRPRIQSDQTFIIDVRLPHERRLHPTIPGAQEWSILNFKRYFKRIPWDREVILICMTGVISFQAAYQLANAGHPNVKVVYGGYSSWKSIHPEMHEQ